MTTIIAFEPNNNAAPPFSAIFTLDGQGYNGAVTWNLAGQRWYLTISDQSGATIWSGAMVGSPLTSNIYLAPNIFTSSTLLFREDTNQFEQNP